MFPGEAGNIKITDESDFARAEAAQFSALGDVRMGTGIDVHAFGQVRILAITSRSVAFGFRTTER